MKLYNLKPTPCLRQYISRFWVWEDELSLPQLLPGTGTELMFHYGQPLRGKTHTGEAFTVPPCHIISPRQKYYTLEAGKSMGFFSVRFRAGAFRHFCPVPCNELINSFIDIKDLWGKQGQSFGQQVMEAGNLEERISIVEKALIRFLDTYHRSEGWLDMAVKKVLCSYNAVNIQAISRQLFISERQLERKFKESVGVTPKGFQRISRFEAVIRHLLLNRQPNYLTAALENGYYDQSHFIKDFNAYVGEQPSSFLQNKNFMSHFYNKTLSG
jgi:AraC-like DNA-binding protein